MVIDSTNVHSLRGRHVNVGNPEAMSKEDYCIITGTMNIDPWGRPTDSFDCVYVSSSTGSRSTQAWPGNGALSNGAWEFHATDVLSLYQKALGI